MVPMRIEKLSRLSVNGLEVALTFQSAVSRVSRGGRCPNGTHVPTRCLADRAKLADWKVGDTAGWETCATGVPSTRGRIKPFNDPRRETLRASLPTNSKAIDCRAGNSQGCQPLGEVLKRVPVHLIIHSDQVSDSHKRFLLTFVLSPGGEKKSFCRTREACPLPLGERVG